MKIYFIYIYICPSLSLNMTTVDIGSLQNLQEWTTALSHNKEVEKQDNV